MLALSEGRTRKIEELVVRYKKHSNLKDLFVEGEKDLKFFGLIFKTLNIRINLYRISTVVVPQSTADGLKLELDLFHNCKNRVITLAFALDSKLSKEKSNQCRCVVDKDFDLFMKNKFNCSILLYTDYNCIEMYVFNELAISKFIDLVLSSFPISAKKLISKFEKVLPILFLFRLTNESLNLGLEWKNFIDNCSINKCDIAFDFDKFLTKFFNNNRLNKSNQENFKKEFEENKKRLTTDIRNQIHKDDFKGLFIKFIRKCGKITDFNKNSKIFPLMSCVEISEIKDEELFVNLIKWYNES